MGLESEYLDGVMQEGASQVVLVSGFFTTELPEKHSWSNLFPKYKVNF